ncbi:MAG TPA: nitrilase-related carbon-nitrogen hydrolase [bacterium]|jgi:predicted amidohydrolase
MRIGIVQTSPVFGNKAANRKEIEELTAEVRADLWVMPELALTGYEYLDREEARTLSEEVPGGETCQWLIQFCAERNCHAVIGLAERSHMHVFNAAVLTGPEGVVGQYRKLHLFDHEKKVFDPGNIPFTVFPVGSARVGLMICFDWRFPEAARTLALRGAQIIAHPSNLVMPYCQHAMVTRSLENAVFCVTANRVGTERRAGRCLTFTGHSQIVSSKGTVLADAPGNEHGVAVVEIDPSAADNKRVTMWNDLVGDRRADFYEKN